MTCDLLITEVLTFPSHTNFSNVSPYSAFLQWTHPTVLPCYLELKAQTLFLVSHDDCRRALPISNINTGRSCCLRWQRVQKQAFLISAPSLLSRLSFRREATIKNCPAGMTVTYADMSDCKKHNFFYSPVWACKPESWSGVTEGIYFTSFLFWIQSTWMWKSHAFHFNGLHYADRVGLVQQT